MKFFVPNLLGFIRLNNLQVIHVCGSLNNITLNDKQAMSLSFLALIAGKTIILSEWSNILSCTEE